MLRLINFSLVQSAFVEQNYPVVIARNPNVVGNDLATAIRVSTIPVLLKPQTQVEHSVNGRRQWVFGFSTATVVDTLNVSAVAIEHKGHNQPQSMLKEATGQWARGLEGCPEYHEV